MEKLEALVIIIVVLAAVGALYFLYSGTGFAFQTKDYCTNKVDITLRKGGLMMPEKTLLVEAPKRNDMCEFKLIYQPAGEGVSSDFGTIELIDFVGGKARLIVTDDLGEHEVVLEKDKPWYDDIIAINAKDMDDRRQSVVLQIESKRKTVCAGDYVWSQTRGRYCPNIVSPADIKFELIPSRFG